MYFSKSYASYSSMNFFGNSDNFIINLGLLFAKFLISINIMFPLQNCHILCQKLKKKKIVLNISPRLQPNTVGNHDAMTMTML